MQLATVDNIDWIGINSYGGWDCSSSRKIPVWTENKQSFCSYSSQNQQSAVENNEEKNSIWDVLKPDFNVAPIEDAVPTN